MRNRESKESEAGPWQGPGLLSRVMCIFFEALPELALDHITVFDQFSTDHLR